ncbi:MAG: hypothetical protein ACREBH_04540 [Candidatus Micrarchaeaceae archaeon]
MQASNSRKESGNRLDGLMRAAKGTVSGRMDDLKRLARTTALGAGLAIASVGLMATPAHAQQTIAAASCNESDVATAIGGAVSGDTVSIPAGTCTWTSALSVSSGITITGSGTSNEGPLTFGAGSPTTVILDDSTSGNLIKVTMPSSSQTFKLESIEVEPYTSTTVLSAVPISILGTCDSSGCSQIRLTNLLFSGFNESGNSSGSGSNISVDNVFGVVDHCTFNALNPTGVVEALNIELSSYQGIGQYGDNSWSQPFTWGAAQALYAENNVTSDGYQLTETEYPVSFSEAGGAREVVRFNHLGSATVGAPIGWHGTETGGRWRGGLQVEAYGNDYTFDLANTGASALLGLRGGTGIMFGNTIDITPSSAWLNGPFNFDTQRTWRMVAWGTCSGFSPWDANDGADFSVWNGTVASLSGSTITVSGAALTAGAFDLSTSSPGPKLYAVMDGTTGGYSVITGNTANTLTVSGLFGQLNGETPTFTAGDPILIYSSTLYAAGTYTGNSGTTTLTDSSKSWTANQWEDDGYPYSLSDITQPFTGEIWYNTSDTANFFVDAGGGPGGAALTWNNGDQYVITRASFCLDQDSYGNERLLSNIVPTPGAPNGTMTPTYEFDDTVGGSGSTHYLSPTNTMRIVGPPTDYIAVVGKQTAQTSSTFPFNGTGDMEKISAWTCTYDGNCTFTVPSTENFAVGMPVAVAMVPPVSGSYQPYGDSTVVGTTSSTITIGDPGESGSGSGGGGGVIKLPGTGWGPLADRPASCTPNVGYWATDQGNWNKSGNGFGQGELFVCTSPNTWTLYYEPYTYPYPLAVAPPAPPTDLTSTTN